MTHERAFRHVFLEENLDMPLSAESIKELLIFLLRKHTTFFSNFNKSFQSKFWFVPKPVYSRTTMVCHAQTSWVVGEGPWAREGVSKRKP